MGDGGGWRGRSLMRRAKERSSRDVRRSEAGQNAKGSTSFRKVNGKKGGKEEVGDENCIYRPDRLVVDEIERCYSPIEGIVRFLIRWYRGRRESGRR